MIYRPVGFCFAYHCCCIFQASAARKLAWQEDRYSGVFGLLRIACWTIFLLMHSISCFQYISGFSIIKTCLSYHLLRVPQNCFRLMSPIQQKWWLLPSLFPSMLLVRTARTQAISPTFESSIRALKALLHASFPHEQSFRQS